MTATRTGDAYGEVVRLEGECRRLEVELERSREQREQIDSRLQAEQAERERQQTRAAYAERRLESLECEDAVERIDGLLHSLMLREWMRQLDEDDRRRHPLGPYVLLPELLEQMARRPAADLSRERVAYVCAMIASGYPRGLEGIRRHPLGERPGSNGERGFDGAQGWQCDLDEGGYRGPRLHYWQRPDQTVEFTGLSRQRTHRLRRRIRG